MNYKTASILNIVISIIFAGAMIVSSHIFDGSEHEKTATYIILALWWIPFSILTTLGVQDKKRD